MAHGDQTIQLELDRALALVLFEFLARTLDENDAEALEGAFEHGAELPALLKLLALLEDHLDETFADDYRARLTKARELLLRKATK